MGITSPLQQKENSSNGRPVDDYDGKKPDPEDPALADHPFGKDVESFTRFMRSLKAPPTEEKIADAMAVERGRALFMDNNKTGCAICHVPSWTTVPVGTAIGDFKVPVELGNKTIRPYSDFMLHDIGTGDGIVQTQHAQRPPHGCEVKENIRYSTIEVGEKVHRVLTDMYTYYEDDKGADGTADKKRDKQRVMRSSLVSTAYLIRTAPLWGLRTRPQMMHDGLSLTIDEAIRRHEKQADRAERNYSRKLTPAERNDLLAYLGTL